MVVSTLIGGRDLPLVEKDGVFRNDLEIALRRDRCARARSFPGDRNTVNLTLKPDTVPRLRAAGFRIISSLDAAAGPLSAAHRRARSQHQARRSRSSYDVEVPDFVEGTAVDEQPRADVDGQQLRADGAAEGSAREDAARRRSPPTATSARTTRSRCSPKSTKPRGAPAHKVEISLTMKAEGGQTVFQTREERDSWSWAATAAATASRRACRSRTFAPGLYVLRVEAQSRTGDRPTAARETIVNVVFAGRLAHHGCRPSAPHRCARGSGATNSRTCCTVIAPRRCTCCTNGTCRTRRSTSDTSTCRTAAPAAPAAPVAMSRPSTATR